MLVPMPCEYICMKSKRKLVQLYEELDAAHRQEFFRDYYWNRSVIYIAFYHETHKDTMEKVKNYIIDNYGQYIREMYFAENFCLKIYLNVP
jgi:ribulose bisphosphate carboxylase small subunit